MHRRKEKRVGEDSGRKEGQVASRLEMDEKEELHGKRCCNYLMLKLMKLDNRPGVTGEQVDKRRSLEVR